MTSAQANLPRVTVNIGEACAMLGISRDHFDSYVKPELKIIGSGRLQLVPVSELSAGLSGTRPVSSRSASPSRPRRGHKVCPLLGEAS